MASLPIVLVDMDGPLADFDQLFFRRCRENGWSLDCERRQQRHRFATDHMPDERERRLAREMVNTPGWFADLPVTDGALAGLNALADVADVWICSKPLEANPTCRDEKAKWLVEHFGAQWERRLILAPDKSLVRGDILLDDAPKRRWFDRAYWTPVLFDAPFNRDWTDLPRWDWSRPVEELLAHPLS